ncbi:MAG: NHL domain-containing protein, partial [Flavisolibacter sp.]
MRVRVSPWITMFILLGIAGGFQFASVSEDVSFNIEIPRANPLKEPLTTKHVANPRLYFDISSVTTYAGSGATGSLNGPAALASFEGPNDVAVDFSGNVYISDGNMIRKINKIGIVTTLAGSNLYGFADGHGANAKFTGPMGIAVDGSGNLYVADAGNHRIRKVTPSGYVSTIAGSGIEGFRDGSGVFAQFYDPRDVAVDHAGNIYVADYQNNRIRKINQEGLVTTFAGDGNVDYDDGPGTTASFYSTQSLAFDPKGNLYVTQVYGRLRKITPAGVV